jgi:hypothetical protein
VADAGRKASPGCKAPRPYTGEADSGKRVFWPSSVGQGMKGRSTAPLRVSSQCRRLMLPIEDVFVTKALR